MASITINGSTGPPLVNQRPSLRFWAAVLASYKSRVIIPSFFEDLTFIIPSRDPILPVLPYMFFSSIGIEHTGAVRSARAPPFSAAFEKRHETR
jgi:hypothetical protein